MPQRSCDDCTACCTALAIDELDKPGFETCAHVGTSDCAGCGIYHVRPDCCKDFKCLWLDGHLHEDDRPDKLGVIFTTTGHPELGTIPLLIEVTPDAVQQPAIKQAVEQFLRRGPVAIATPNGGKLIQPAVPTPLTVGGRVSDVA